MITGLDHLVLTVADLEATLRFYRDGLGMRHERFGAGRSALHFCDHKINLHVAGREFEPKALRPAPGSADLCFVTDRPLTEVMDRLAAIGHPAFLGPVERDGAVGPLASIYARDPDGNLIEIARRASPNSHDPG
jgi:catechol 2,3-dioxygenase-like lactoylglutathione lyase family enzyme